MNSPADIIAKYLIDVGVVTAPTADTDNPIFVGQLASDPNTAIGTFDGKSKTDGRLMAGTTIFHPAVQIITRAKNYRVAWDLANTIKTKIEEIKDVDVSLEGNDYIIRSAQFTTDILPLGTETDKNRRQLMSINFKITLGG